MVVVEVAGMSFYDGVEDLVAVGAGEFGVFAQFLGNFNGCIGIVEFAGLEPVGLVAKAGFVYLGGVNGGDD